VGVAHGAAQQRADEQGDPADHDGDEGAAAQDVAAQVPDVGAGAEAPPGAAGQAAVDGVDRGPGDDQRRPGGEVDDVRRVVDRDALPADRDQQRGGEQGADHGGHALPAAEDGEDADDDLEEGDDEAGADGVFEGELPQRLGDFPGVQGVQPGDHGAALAAVEVDGVAQLAHAGVDGDEAEEDAQREQHDTEVHPAAGVVGVPGRVVAVAPGAGSGVLVRDDGPRARVLERVVVVGRFVVARFVVGAADRAHGRQQGAAAVGALGADDGRLQGGRVVAVAVAAADAGDDLAGAGV